MTTVRFYADFICPFCYAAEAQLLPRIVDAGHEVRWLPYELHPETPREGRPFKGRNSGRLWNSMRRVASEWQLPMARKAPTTFPNTHRTLMAALAAKRNGELESFREAAYAAYWVRGENIGTPEVIASLLTDVEIDEPLTEEQLGEIRDEAQRACVLAGPAFVIGDRVLHGLHEWHVIERFLTQPSSE